MIDMAIKIVTQNRLLSEMKTAGVREGLSKKLHLILPKWPFLSAFEGHRY